MTKGATGLKLTFLGAARMVTGSCYLVQAPGVQFLVDCGLFQGSARELNRQRFPFDPKEIDFVLLTHAHIDHSGRLPLLYRQGFRGHIFSHGASVDLAEIMLLDSAHIQEQDANWQNKKARRAGRPTQPPLYTVEDVEALLPQFRGLDYEQMHRVNDRVSVRLRDAGHILGAAIVEVFVQGEGKLVFSGDVGQPDRPILRDPSLVEDADYLVMESTYGNRMHEPPEHKANHLRDIIRRTVAAGGNLIIPAFSVGRTQEILYELNALVEAKQLEGIPVFVDSPLSIRATEITRKYREVFDREANERLRAGDDPFHFDGLRFVRTVEESKRLNGDQSSKVIIAASGMCEGGRVVHHLKHNLWREDSTVLFVGFQAEGTLGRKIRDGARLVRILGEEVAVRARVEVMEGFSAHADQGGLLSWLEGFDQKRPQRIFLTHGEPDEQEALADLLLGRGYRVEMPGLGDSATLMAAEKPVRVRKAKPSTGLGRGAAVAAGGREVELIGKEYRRLLKLWQAHKQKVPTPDAREFASRAVEVRTALEGLRRIVEAQEETDRVSSDS